MKRPCLTCGTPTTRTHCHTCQQPLNRARNKRRVHYHGDYQTRRKQLKATHPHGPCWICGQPIPTNEWTADHINPGHPNSPLAPAHQRCNSSRGATPPPQNF